MICSLKNYTKSLKPVSLIICLALAVVPVGQEIRLPAPGPESTGE